MTALPPDTWVSPGWTPERTPEAPRASAPGTVWGAAITTWVISLLVLGSSLVFAVVLWLVFTNNIEWEDEPGAAVDATELALVGVFAFALAVLAAAVASVAAWFTTRGRTWAWWTLLALAVVTVPMTWLFSAAIVVLLLLPASRAWCGIGRATHEKAPA